MKSTIPNNKPTPLRATNINLCLSEKRQLKRVFKIIEMRCNCNNSYIIKEPLYREERIRFFNIKFFNVFRYICLRCKWKGELIKQIENEK